MTEEVIVWDTRDPLRGLTRDAFEAQLRDALSGRVVEAWVFGSYARNDMHPGSDVDLALVVENPEGKFVERTFAFLDVLDIGPRIDLLVYTPAEWAALVREPATGFWTDVSRDGKRLM